MSIFIKRNENVESPEEAPAIVQMAENPREELLDILAKRGEHQQSNNKSNQQNKGEER